MTAFIAMPPVFYMLCAPGSPWSSRRRSCIDEWLLQRLGAVIAQRGIAADALGRCVLRPWHLESLGTLVKRQAA